MSKKIFGFNIEIKIKERLNSVAKSKYMSSSALLNQIIENYVDEAEGVIKKGEEKKKKTPPIHNRTEAERLVDWEWRKGMVKDGKLPTQFADEFPIPELPPEKKDIYLRPDRSESDRSEDKRTKEEAEAEKSALPVELKALVTSEASGLQGLVTENPST